MSEHLQFSGKAVSRRWLGLFNILGLGAIELRLFKHARRLKRVDSPSRGAVCSALSAICSPPSWENIVQSWLYIVKLPQKEGGVLLVDMGFCPFELTRKRTISLSILSIKMSKSAKLKAFSYVTSPLTGGLGRKKALGRHWFCLTVHLCSCWCHRSNQWLSRWIHRSCYQLAASTHGFPEPVITALM